jgi:hypothetical protein
MYPRLWVQVGENAFTETLSDSSDRGITEFMPEPKRRKLESVDEKAVQKQINPLYTDVMSHRQLLENSPPLNLKYPNGVLVPMIRSGREVIIKRMRTAPSSLSSSKRAMNYYWVINADGTEEQVFTGNTLGSGFYYVSTRQPVPSDAKFKHEFVNRYQKHYATNANGEYVRVGTSCQLKITLRAKPTLHELQSTDTSLVSASSVAASGIGLFAASSHTTSTVEDNSEKARIEFILN